MRKYILSVCCVFIMLKLHSQDFNLVKRDSLHIQLNEGYIIASLPNFNVRYDSVFTSLSSRLQALVNAQIKPVNDGEWPLEIRYIRNADYPEFLKYYSLPDESETFASQWNQNKGATNLHPPGEWRIYMADQARDIRFTLMAWDSSNLLKLLQAPIFKIRDSVETEIKEFKFKKYEDLYFYQWSGYMRSGFSTSGIAWQRINTMTGKIGIGPALICDQLAVGVQLEIDYVKYKKFVPKYRIGLVSSNYVSNLSGDSNRISRMQMLQLKCMFTPAVNKTWIGFKVGIGSYEANKSGIGGFGFVYPSPPGYRRVASFGFSFENTRFADFDLDYFITYGKDKYGAVPAIPVLLTMKLPF